jgi:hypothetical protein
MIKKQQGFSLVILLTLLAAIGGYALTAMSASLRPSLSLASAVHINAELGQSRQALISYSAHYLYLYGPKGAGIGHLPCPDTSSLNSDATSWSVNQGPNPPCGNHPVAVGHLPSHISFPKGRYMLHAGFGPRVDYTVSDRVINNPGNHPVSPALMLAVSSNLQHAALIRHQALTFNSNRTISSEIIITKKALMLAIRPAVAAWLVEKLNDQGSLLCVLNQKILLPDNFYELGDRCHQLGQLAQRCNSEENASKVWQTTSEKFQSNLLLLYLADVVTEQFQCATSTLEQIHIDYVPAKQHWLVRNGWLNWISVKHDDQCVQLPLQICRLIYFNQRSPDAQPEPLVLRWISE